MFPKISSGGASIRSGLRNFKKIYKPIVEEQILYANSAPAPLILEQGGKLEHEDQTS